MEDGTGGELLKDDRQEGGERHKDQSEGADWVADSSGEQFVEAAFGGPPGQKHREEFDPAFAGESVKSFRVVTEPLHRFAEGRNGPGNGETAKGTEQEA